MYIYLAGSSVSWADHQAPFKGVQISVILMPGIVTYSQNIWCIHYFGLAPCYLLWLLSRISRLGPVLYIPWYILHLILPSIGGWVWWIFSSYLPSLQNFRIIFWSVHLFFMDMGFDFDQVSSLDIAWFFCRDDIMIWYIYYNIMRLISCAKKDITPSWNIWIKHLMNSFGN